MPQGHAKVLALIAWAVLCLRSGPAAATGEAAPAQAAGVASATAAVLPGAPPAELEAAGLRRALQVLVVLTPGWDAPRGTAQRFERSTLTAPFRRVGRALPVWVGRAGLGWRSDAAASPPAGAGGPRKQEGDGRSPAGVLGLGGMWGYGPAPPTGVRLPYKSADALDRCVDDVGSPEYNQLTRQAPDRPPSWQSAEALRLPTAHYKYLVVMNYNVGAPRRGAGSCIFLHVAPPPGGPTAGCTALAEDELLTVLRWLDPARHPVILQLPAPALAAAGAAWAIPGELTSSVPP